MPTLIEGVVIERRHGLSRIKLRSGRRFWTKTPKGVGIRDMVYVAWNYMKDAPSQVLTLEEVKNTPTEIGLDEDRSFSNPMDEGIEVEVEVETRSLDTEPNGCGIIEIDEVEDEVSRNPLNGGDDPTKTTYFHERKV